jgi:hypothetical protein
MVRSAPPTLLSLLLLGGLALAQQGAGQDDKILERGDKLFGEARFAYGDARANSSVTAFVDAGFKLEEARIKFLVLQEIGSPENQKLAADRLRAINQLGKLIHDGKVAISGSAADSAGAKPTDPGAVPGTPAVEPPAKPEAGPAKPPVDVMKRAPAPEAAKLRETEKAIKDLFKEQYSKKTPEDRRALARTLMDQAVKSDGDPSAQWVLWREAQDVAIQAGDIKTALQAIDLTARVFDVDVLSMKNTVLTSAGRSLKTPEDAVPLTDALFVLSDEYIIADQYDSADKTANSALLFARRTNDPVMVARATVRTKEVAEAKTLFQGMKKQLEVQAKNPDDPGANLEIGRFLCFVKGNWEFGLRFIVKGSDAGLKTLAEKELALIMPAEDRAVLGDGWYDLGEKEKSPLRKSQLFAHAKVVYESALPESSGLLRAKIEKRLASLSDPKQGDPKAPAQDFPTVVEALIDGDSVLHVTPTGIYWESRSVAKPGRHNDANEPTWINSHKWMPQWGKPSESRGADKSKPLLLRIGRIDNLKIELIAVGIARENTGIEPRDPIQTRVDNGEFTILIPDSQLGPRWYKFKVFR